MDRRAVRAYVAGQRAAAERKSTLLLEEGPDVEASIEIALSMIDAADQAGRYPPDALREAGVRDVRLTWQRLRAKLGG